MRKRIYHWQRTAAVALLQRAPIMHVATTSPDNTPVLRSFHGVVVDDFVAFHAAPAGEKMTAIGRPAVVSAEELIAEIPSYFVDPERACPATSYYESVQVHGRLERVDNVDDKARILSALMAKFQPEGGHTAITAEHPHYRKLVSSLLIARVALERLSAKQKLGQNRSADELATICSHLWRRGKPRDCHAIDRLRQVNVAMTTPEFLRGPDGVTLVCAGQASDLPDVVELLASQYWNKATSAAEIRAAHHTSAAWVVARDDHQRVIATARAVSDGVKLAWIADVVVAQAWQGRRVGRALMNLLLDHPAVRNARHKRLATRDAQQFYQRVGFELASADTQLSRFDEMVLVTKPT